MDVILIRHGETAGNRERRYLSRTDEPLSPRGMRQIKQLGSRQLRWLGICEEVGTVFASPLIRAVQSARLLFPAAQLVLLPDLREMDFGIFEGRSANEMVNDPAYTEWVMGGCEAPCPEGEGMDSFSERVCCAFEQAVEQSLQNGGKRLIVVAHGGTIMAVLSRWARPERPYFGWQTPPAGGWRAQLDENSWGVEPKLTDYAPLTRLRL